MAKIKIHSEFTAQPSTHQPNRMLKLSLDFLQTEAKSLNLMKVADQGCGKLRHLPLLLNYFVKVYLIDQCSQLSRKQKIFDIANTTIPDYVQNHCSCDRVSVLTADQFERKALHLDVIINACTFDVVPPKARWSMLGGAYNNLKKHGVMVLIIPRNDQSITKRCSNENRCYDGHLFQHHGKINTFFKNFKEYSDVIVKAENLGFRLLSDMSVYRQVCLIFKKTGDYSV